jgi:hypothetical protein
MRAAFFLPLLLFLSCDSDIVEPKIVGEDPFTLRYGETAVVQPDGAILRFEGLLGDSRCPLNLACFWEGRADVRVWFRIPGGDEIYVQLSVFGYVFLPDTARQQYVDTLGYRIKLLQLDPYPRWPVHRAAEEYVALMKVTSR